MDHPRPITSITQEEEPKVKRKCKIKVFQQSWLEIEIYKDWLTSHSDGTKAYCTACKKVLVCGASKLSRHANRQVHKKKFAQMKKSKNNNNDPSTLLLAAKIENKSHKDKVKAAELKIAFYAEHNIAINTVDHLISLLTPSVAEQNSVKCTETTPKK
ncbi:hypothetical protein EAI_05557 [Harpegnathos saltator]|uniref:Uncharacterized protein n=1 Tax=Harpegnathos saltator TaxID=610380 RepID=E2BUZ1_HARSA|nr:hypothetical protein EAI_05557 [Harpegnathos saltator]